MSFVDKLMKSGALQIHYIKCKDAEGRPCYFYIQSSEAKIAALKKASTTDGIDLRDYGTIIESGFGTYTSDEVKAFLLEKYDYDVDKLFPNDRKES